MRMGYSKDGERNICRCQSSEEDPGSTAWREKTRIQVDQTWGCQRTSMVEVWPRSSQKLSSPQSLWWVNRHLACCCMDRDIDQRYHPNAFLALDPLPARGALRVMSQVVVTLGFLVPQHMAQKGRREGRRGRGKEEWVSRKECGSASKYQKSSLPPLQLFFLLVPTPPSRTKAFSALLLPKWVSTGLPADGHEELEDH